MSFLDTMARAFSRPHESRGRDLDWWFDDAGVDLGPSNPKSNKVTPKRALGHAPVWRGVNLIASKVAGTPLYVYKNVSDDNRVKDKKHSGYKCLARKANAAMTAFTLRETLTFHALFFGNGYALIERSVNGGPDELIPLSPFDTFPIQKDGQVWIITTVGGERRKIPYADVLHIKGLSFDGLAGLSVIEILAEALKLGLNARDFALRFFSEGMNASGILMIPGHLKGDAIKAAIRDFNEIAVGIKNQHKVGLLQDGVKWQPTSVDAEKSQLLDSRKLDVRDVANILGLPAYLLGDDSRTSHSSLEQESQSFVDNCLDVWYQRWETEARVKLLSPDEQESDTHEIEFFRVALLRTDAKTRQEIYASQRQWGQASANDCLRRENQPSIGKQGDVYLTPSNMMNAERLLDPPAPPALPPVPPPGDPPPDDTPPADDPPTDPPADDPAPPTGNRDQVIMSHVHSAIEERAARLDEIAIKRLRTAAAKSSDVAALAVIVGDCGEKYREALEPILKIADAIDNGGRCRVLTHHLRTWEVNVLKCPDVDTAITNLADLRRVSLDILLTPGT